MSGLGFWSVVAIFWLLALADGLFFSKHRTTEQQFLMLGVWCLVGFTVGLLWSDL